MFLFDFDERPPCCDHAEPAEESAPGVAIVPRDYQQRGIEKTFELFEAGAEGVLFRQFTGSGKTVTGSLIIHRWINQGDDYHAIVMCHERQLVQQFADEIQAVIGIEPGIEMADQRVQRHAMPKIVVASRQTLQERVVGDGEEAARISRLYKFDNTLNWLVVADECHRWSYRLKSCRHIVDWFAANEKSRRLGLSVGGDSVVNCILCDGTVFCGTIADFWKKCSDRKTGIAYPDGVSVRAFDGQSFVWKPLRSVIAHDIGNKKAYRVKFERGRSLLITEDHSIYRIALTDGSKKSEMPSGELEEVLGGELKPGDLVLLEDSIESIPTIDNVNVIDYAKKKGICIAGEYRDWINENIRESNGYANSHKTRWKRLRGPHGPYVTREEHAGIGGTGIAYLSGAGNWCRTQVPVSAMAYILGFYVGNGWCENGRVGLSAKLSIVDKLIGKLRILGEHVCVNETVRKMPGKSVEVRFSNCLFADFVKAVCPGNAKDKPLPSIVWNFSNSDLLEFLHGMIDTDGHDSARDRNRRRCFYTTTSLSLVNGLVEILKRLGVIASVHKRRRCNEGGTIDGRKITGNHQGYTVHFSMWELLGIDKGRRGSRKKLHAEIQFAGVPAKVLSVTEEITEVVYDFSVDDDKWQTFVASGVLVHNTATPMRGDKVSLRKLFPEIGADYPQFDLRGGPCGVNDGWAVPYDQRFVEVAGVDFKNLREVSGDFDEHELESIMGEREQMLSLVKPMLDIAGDRKTLIFNPTVAVAKMAAFVINEFSLCRCECGAPQWVEREAIEKEGLPPCRKCDGALTVEVEGNHAESLDGSYPDNVRRDCYQRFAKKQFRFLSVCGLCIAEGTLVLTDQGEVPIECVTTDMKLWDGVEFVSHDGVISKGRREVIEYAGLKATEWHKVWTDFGWKDFAECKIKGHTIAIGCADGKPVLESDRRYRFGIERENKTEVSEVYDILNAGPRHRFTANGLIVSNCREGFNDRGIGAVAIFRPTKSRALAEQMKGRGCRPLAGVVDGLDTPEERRAAIAASEKPSCIIIDLVGVSGMADCASTAHLLAEGKPDEVIELANENAIKKSAAGESVDMVEEILAAEQEIEDREARKRREAEEREKARLARLERERREREEAARKARLLGDVHYTETRVNPGQRINGQRNRKNTARMPFGKHKGQLIADLHTRYIEVLLEKNPPRTLWLKSALERELRERKGQPEPVSQPSNRQPTLDEINMLLLER